METMGGFGVARAHGVAAVLVCPVRLREAVLRCLDAMELSGPGVITLDVGFQWSYGGYPCGCRGAFLSATMRTAAVHGSPSWSARASWDCSRLCLAVLGYYRVLVVGMGLRGVVGLDPGRLFALCSALTRGRRKGGCAADFSYAQMRCFVRRLGFVVLEPGGWCDDDVVRRVAEERAVEFLSVEVAERDATGTRVG